MTDRSLDGTYAGTYADHAPPKPVVDEQLQLFPPLSETEYASLKADIEARGILIPIEIDQEGKVVDGFHRLHIAEELGIDPPVIERHFDSDRERRTHSRSLNLKRRHLDPVTWGEMYERQCEVEYQDTIDNSQANLAAGLTVVDKEEIDKRVAAELGVSHRTAKRRRQAAHLPEAKKKAIQEGKATVHTALKDVARDARKSAAASREAEGRREPPTSTTKYQTIVVDPPWRYERDDIRGAAEHHYDTMTFDQIAAYPVGDLAAANAHLYLWITNPHLPFVWEIVKAWGFEYKTMLTWVKPQMGTGHYFRGATEHVLFCTRGNLPLRDSGIPNWFMADRTEHSQKPLAFYELVERASFGPYVELFARRQREGWAVFGDEV